MVLRATAFCASTSAARARSYGPEGNGFLRLNVGCPREKLERGVEGLIAALRSLS